MHTWPVCAKGLWITHPDAIAADSKMQPVTLDFRRQLELGRVPERMPVRLTADSRYILFVNGKRVSAGPSRGDLQHWRYRRVDLAPYLKRGSNELRATVWNDGNVAALAQLTAGTGLWIEAETGAGAPVETGPAWHVRVDPARSAVSGREQLGAALGKGKFFAAAPAEVWDFTASSSRASWQSAVSSPSRPRRLESDRIPEMRYELAQGDRIVGREGVGSTSFPLGPLVIAPRREVTIVLDANRLQTAYPRLATQGGSGAEISLTYAEAPSDRDGNYLADRSAIAAGKIRGLTDRYKPRGLGKEIFEPLWWRTWRFLEIRVKTADEPITLSRFSRYETDYPFVERGWFRSNDTELNRIWQVGWNTVRVDAHETFMDTAYWEQYQYIGDSRIEAMVARLLTADDRLADQAIEAFDNAKVDGLPPSRWPSRVPQSIPPFALLWIDMLHDAWMYRADSQDMVRQRLPGVRSILAWYERFVRPDGLVGTTPGWEFIDWRPGLDNYPRTTNPKDSEPCIVSLLAIGAYRDAARMEQALGEPERADKNVAAASNMAEAVRKQCWSQEKGLFANQPDKSAFSQHANLLAVLNNVVPLPQQRALLERITVPGSGFDAPEGVTPVTYYFAWYLFKAFDHAGMGDRYLGMLGPWRDMLRRGFTSWPETPDPTRSDSHAWTSHPTADLLTIVAGIKPAAPGFAAVTIAPHLGSLTRLDAAVAHPAGLVRVRYKRKGKRLDVVVDLPATVLGTFEWSGQHRALRGGRTAFSL